MVVCRPGWAGAEGDGLEAIVKNGVVRCVGFVGVLAMVSAFAAAPATAIDEAHRRAADGMISRASAYLRSQQDGATGGWNVTPEGPQLPAITGLVVTGLLMSPEVTPEDPAAARGLEFILEYAQPDGGIYDRILPSYNTSICVSALARAAGRSEDAARAVAPAVAFLRTLQWSEGAREGTEETGVVTREHPFYGGVGYGRQGRPDLSNTQFFVQAMHDAGVAPTDAAYQRALVFLSRCQMADSVNDMAYADGSSQGGFVYATSENKDNVGSGQSQTAGEVWETLDDGTRVSRLRAYGSMTYGGFKSYLYAALKRDDERVRLAYGWIRRNYTVRENPGIGSDGQYYYYLVFARALAAWGLPTVETIGEGGAAEERDWANDLIDQLESMQSADGSFKSVDERWMEDNPVLITAYSLIALQNAVGRK
jgi:squalene-hopene/tetraprenyl-beta-curcumene cyclase